MQTEPLCQTFETEVWNVMSPSLRLARQEEPLDFLDPVILKKVQSYCKRL